MKSIPSSAIILAVLVAAAQASPAKILQSWDFDGDKPFHDLVIQGDHPAVVADPVNPSNKVMRSVLQPGAKRPERSEVMPGVIKIGDERWVGVRILRPDSVQNKFNCFFQLGPVDGAPGHGGGGLYQLNSYGKDIWTVRGFMERVGAKGFSQPIGPITTGKWDDFVFHVKFRDDARGFLEVWKNGVSVFRHEGPNGFAGDKMRIKWGVYVGKGNVPTAPITALYDNVVIGDERSSYQEVAPKAR